MRKPLLAYLLVLLPGLLWLSPRAMAQAGDDEPVSVRAVLREDSLPPGGTAVVALEITHAPHFHTWPAKIVQLPPDIDSFAIRSSIELGKSASKHARIGSIQWPEPRTGSVPDPENNKTVQVPLYSGKEVAYVTLAIAPGAPAGPIDVPLTYSYQACNESNCLMPQDVDLSLSLTITPGVAAKASGDPALFVGYKPPGAGPSGHTGSSASPPPQPAGSPSLLGFHFGGGTLVLFLLALAGGVLLNLTPCVLPVIPIKIMTLVQHAGSPGRRVTLGLWMAAGVVAFWVAVGLPMVLVPTLDASQIIFGTWWVTLGLGLLIALMGLGIMGLFLIQLPQSVYMINPKADTPWGSFLFGIMTAILGLPCFGFVVGGLLAGAATLPRVSIAAVFLGMGIGMAAPYLVLAIWPALISRIPRTGPASELVKQVMGLLLLAAAAFFIAAGLKGLLTDKPYLSGSISFWAVAFFVLIAGVWLTLRTLQIAKHAWPKVVMPVLSVAAVLGIVLFAVASTRADREDWLRAHAAAMEDGSLVPGTWQPYTPARLKAALDSGRVVIADFTADWCLICKSLKRGVLDRDPVRARIQQSDVILLEVDNTSKQALGWKYLKSLGQTGVPTLAVYGPGVDKPLIFNTYRPETVLDAIARAKGQQEARGNP